MIDRSIFLIGFSGSGKSTIGLRLAQRLKVPYYDTDAMIERMEDCSIVETFRRSGERRFRSLETDVIARLCRGVDPHGVVALGGGAFQDKRNRERLLQNGLTVYLSCSAREIDRRLRRMQDRPLMNVRPGPGETVRQARLRKIRTLLKQRVPNYRKAHVRCSTTDAPVGRVVQKLYRKIRRHHGPRKSETSGS
ncbi:MAG TPA: shikimate kinase [Acidobacteriota bacterium]|nr:shikimate kinase [Acidobacteriota bacterium]